jgi:hypothetical protein
LGQQRTLEQLWDVERLRPRILLMSDESKKSGWRAFWDFFVLFSGISTASNLSRTRKDPIQTKGFFLFRKTKQG